MLYVHIKEVTGSKMSNKGRKYFLRKIVDLKISRQCAQSDIDAPNF